MVNGPEKENIKKQVDWEHLPIKLRKHKRSKMGQDMMVTEKDVSERIRKDDDETGIEKMCWKLECPELTDRSIGRGFYCTFHANVGLDLLM